MVMRLLLETLVNTKCGPTILPYKNERQLIASETGTMGFGIPAAIGAKLANPDKEVILFVGDGGFNDKPRTSFVKWLLCSDCVL